MEDISEEQATQHYEVPEHPDGSPNPLAFTSPVPSTHGGHLDGSEILSASHREASEEAPPPIEKSRDDYMVEKRFSVMLAPHAPTAETMNSARNNMASDSSSSGHPEGSTRSGRTAGKTTTPTIGRAGPSSTNKGFQGWTSETDAANGGLAAATPSQLDAQTPKTKFSWDGSDGGDDGRQHLPKFQRSVRPSTDTRVSQDTVRTFPKSAAAQSVRMLARRSMSKLRGRPSTNSINESVPDAGAEATAPFPYGLAARAQAENAKQTNKENAGTQWASERNGGGDGNTIAQLYAVFGLPKDPSVWTLAEEDCVAGVQHMQGAISRFWRPEVLGCSICPPPSEVLGKSASATAANAESNGATDGTAKGTGKDADGKKSSPKFIEMSDGRGGVERVETARVLSKALKLSFTREVEVVVEQGQYPPTSTSHTFSFSVPTLPGTSDGLLTGSAPASAIMPRSAPGSSRVNGETFGVGARNRSASIAPVGEDMHGLTPFYGVVLTVWSAADEKRAKTIRKELARAAKQRSQGKASTTQKGGALEETATSADYAAKSASSVFFMPYAICIVSRYPLYNLLGDWNKMAWHKYSRNIEMHNQLMSTILRHPAPRLGEDISIGSPDKDLSLHGTFPGAMEWSSGLTGVDFVMWPLFRALSVDNILTICEIAQGHNGRILFVSRHPALLGMAVDTIKYMVEQRGWRGVTHQSCHARDVRIFVEDPGSWIIAIPAELRSIIEVTSQVCIVDLDINNVECAQPPTGAISQGPLRQKRLRRLAACVQNIGNEHSPPRDFVEAYPGARFRPLSRIVTRDANSAYQQLQAPSWWNEVAVVQAIDVIFKEGSRPSLLKRMFKKQKALPAATASETAAIVALRKRARTFVDARDGLENKIGRLNKRLAFLISESEMWRSQFSKIQILVDRLTKEANDLRGKVDKERRESRRLSTTLAQRDLDHVQIQVQLKETESARELAIAELKRMQTAMESVDRERDAMMQEIRTMVSGGGSDSQDLNLSMSRLMMPSFNPLTRSDSPTGSQMSMTPSQAADYILKSRATAEARINQGRGESRAGSESGHSSVIGGLTRSLSQDRAERVRQRSRSASVASHAHAYPDENMNFEIQQRTNVVTDQISRIQQQLETTLTSLEGRRSGTFERNTEGRIRSRRGSNASLSSRYEYRSSIGHGNGVASSSGGIRSDSVMTGGLGSEDGMNGAANEYEQIESVNDTDSRLTASGRRRSSRNILPPPVSSRDTLRNALAVSDSPDMGTVALGSGILPPTLTAKSTLRSPNGATSSLSENSPPSSELVMGEPSTGDTSDTFRYEDIGGPFAQPATNGIEAETMLGSPDDYSHDAITNGVAHQPFLTAVTASGGHGSSGQHSIETTEESGPKSPADVPISLPTLDHQTQNGPGSEIVLPAPGGWTMEMAHGKPAPVEELR